MLQIADDLIRGRSHVGAKCSKKSAQPDRRGGERSGYGIVNGADKAGRLQQEDRRRVVVDVDPMLLQERGKLKLLPHRAGGSDGYVADGGVPCRFAASHHKHVRRSGGRLQRIEEIGRMVTMPVISQGAHALIATCNAAPP